MYKLTEDKAILSHTYLLTAGQTDARGLMPITLVASRAIETATEHANLLGVGYDELKLLHMGWVLVRMTIEIARYPRINEQYTMSTWIEGYNRYFSDRCFEMATAEGERLATIRSVWAAIDTEKRTMANLDEIERVRFPLAPGRCPLPKCRAPQPAKDAEPRESEYTFRYTDLDFNGHVNTLRYIEMVMNLYPLAWHMSHEITGLEASFDHECYYGHKALLYTAPGANDPACDVTQIHSDGRRAATIALRNHLAK